MFISYRRDDSSGQAGRLYDSLSEHFGVANVFMDIDAIGPGEDFVEAIDRALQNCDCVLVVIGPRWLQAEREGQRRLEDPADYLRIEVEHSLARAPRVIPVLVQDADMPGSRDLPDAIRGLARRNAFDLSDSRWRLDVGRLIDALEGIETSLGLHASAGQGSGAADVPAIPASPSAVTGLAMPAPPPGPPYPPPPMPPSYSSQPGYPPQGGYPSQPTYPPQGSATRPAGSLPAWVPPWAAQRIVPISATAVLIVVVLLAAVVLSNGSPSPTAPPASGIAIGSVSPRTGAPGTNPPATNPPATGTPGVTATPAATSSGASTAPNTPIPTTGPTVLPTPAQVLPAGIGLGAGTVDLDETFASAGSFPVSSDEHGSFAYADGAFDIQVAALNWSMWSPNVLPASHAVLSVRGTVLVDTQDATGGVMCGNGSGDYLYGGVGKDNQWVIGHIIANTIQVTESGTLPTAATGLPGSAVDVRLECAVTGGLTDRVQLIVGGIKVADSSAEPRVGPFNRGALLGSSAGVTPALIEFDNVTIASGDALREATETLRSHVPKAFAAACKPITENGSLGQVAALICAPAGSIEQAEYYQFESLVAMNNQYDMSLARFGATATGTDCHAGPSASRYTDGAGKDAGNVSCYPNPGSMGGLIIVWTNESLEIVGGGISTTGTYDSLATWWADAGPLP